MKHSLFILILLLTAALGGNLQAQTQQTHRGNDFWVMFIPNGGEYPSTLMLTAVSDAACTVNVNNPLTSWNQSVTVAAGQSGSLILPNAAVPDVIATPSSHAFHVTATSDVTLLASYTQLASSGVALVLPTASLGTRYVVLDYPADPTRTSNTGAAVGFVAVEEGTTLNMTLPCAIPGHAAGSALTITLNAGQSFLLVTNTANKTFSGMEVTANKPFAMFQGNKLTAVPHDNSGNSSDYMYEQALPVSSWGTDYAFVPSRNRTLGDRLRVVAADSCTLTKTTSTGQVQTVSLQAGETHECDIPANTRWRLHATQPISVAICTRQSSYGGEHGDASMVTIPSLDHGVRHTGFVTFQTTRINTWYLNIVVRTEHIGGMNLDNSPIASSQFSALDDEYSYARLTLTDGNHFLDNDMGAFVAWTYGVGNVESYAYPVGMALIPDNNPCPTKTNKGTDFWATFFYNYHETESFNPGQHRLIMSSDENANVTVTGPNGSNNLTISANNAVTHQVGDNNTMPVATPYSGGYHITSNNDIWLYACNYVRGTQDVATLVPSYALDTTYIVQDYPAWEYGAQVAFVATEDNTVLTMTVPCNIQGTAITAGTTLTPTLQQGQAYMLISDNDHSMFSGMRVTSNGKPFAMFQGGRKVKIPVSGSGSDLLYEQTMPIPSWGTDFIVAGASYQSGNNYIRITSAEDNCSLSIDGTAGPPLNTGQTHEHIIPTNSVCHISTGKPVCVILYLSSYANGGNLGDPSSITIPPTDHGICSSVFKTEQSDNIPNNNHYLNIICPTDIDNEMLLDGNPLPTTSSITLDNYTIHRLPIPWTSSEQGIHRLENTAGPFIAYAYGLGYYESYAFPLGFSLIPIPPAPTPPVITIHDTVMYIDTTCQGNAYDSNGFHITPTQTADTGTLERWMINANGDTVHHYHLVLTVLPTTSSDTTVYIILGDTLFYQSDTITEAGNYTYRLTGTGGCDSVVTLTVTYEGVSLTVSTEGICPGDSVTLTAHGLLYPYWTATPPDPDLEAQQGRTVITVSPRQTTSYALSTDSNGAILDLVVIGIEPPPMPCITTSVPVVDFDHPVVIFNDCSEGSATSQWTFYDGITVSGSHVRRQFHHPLPDSVTVKLTSCNQYHCCYDTVLVLPVEINSVWFPNVFTPNGEQNRTFGCTTSMKVVEFSLTIYNRWGLLVWESSDLTEQWDGTHAGVPMPQASYTYHWRLKDSSNNIHSGIGTVTLIR